MDIENVCRKIQKDFKTIDILINNAATQYTPTFQATNIKKLIEYHLNYLFDSSYFLNIF